MIFSTTEGRGCLAALCLRVFVVQLSDVNDECR
jgi:hypothetical protein